MIRNYHNGVDIKFYGETERNKHPFMGVELEIENKQGIIERIPMSDYVDEAFEGFTHNEYDGSLDEGFEIITQPATLDYHINTMGDKYKKTFKYLTKNGYVSHKTRTCGLHVHVNKTYFGRVEEKQDICTIRLLYLVEKFWDNLVKFSRRKSYQLNEWAHRYQNPPEEIIRRKKRGVLGRYYAVNLTNTDTIEFRLFRGTLKYETFIATLQLVESLMYHAKYITNVEQIRNLTWDNILYTEELKKYWEEVKDRTI